MTRIKAGTEMACFCTQSHADVLLGLLKCGGLDDLSLERIYYAFTFLHDRRVAGYTIKSLNDLDANTEVRPQAADTLGQSYPNWLPMRVERILLRHLHDPSPLVRWEVVWALGFSHRLSTREILAEVRDSDHAPYRAGASYTVSDAAKDAMKRILMNRCGQWLQ